MEFLLHFKSEQLIPLKVLRVVLLLLVLPCCLDDYDDEMHVECFVVCLHKQEAPLEVVSVSGR